MKVKNAEIKNHRAISWNKIYSQGHWTERSSLAQEIHSLIKAEIPWKEREILGRRVDITIRAYFKGKGRRDSDNIASKLYIDGLKDIFLEDDDSRFVRRVTTEAIVGAVSDAILITLREI